MSSLKNNWNLIKLSAKLCLLSLTFSLSISAQQLLTLEELDTVKVFTSLEAALKKPEQTIRLELKKQKLKEIPPAVLSLSNLQYLDLTRNKIDTLPPELGQLKNLRVLILNRNEIDYIPAVIGELKHLLILRASNNYLWEIHKNISELQELEILDIWANSLVILPDEIQDMPGLQEIDMRVNPVKREVQEELQEYLPNCIMHFSYDCKCF